MSAHCFSHPQNLSAHRKGLACVPTGARHDKVASHTGYSDHISPKGGDCPQSADDSCRKDDTALCFFFKKDVQTAAADLISGRLQSVEITYMEHALWIQCATHKDEEGCFVINAAHPDYADTAFTAKMPSAEAFMWLTQYPCGGFLPEGEIWEKKAED